MNSGDWAVIETFYADDAVMMAPNMEAARGPVAIRQAFQSFAPMRPRLSIASDRVVQACDMVPAARICASASVVMDAVAQPNRRSETSEMVSAKILIGQILLC